MAAALKNLKRFEEAKSLLRKMIPVARRVLGKSDEITLGMGWCYAEALYKDKCATLDSLREAVTRLEETERISRRIFGGAHWMVVQIEGCLLDARKVLRARDTPSARA